MEEHGLIGTLKYFGKTAEKICISKPYHATKGYYDNLDACILYHPRTVNRVVWETHCGSYWNVAFTFEVFEPEKWASPLARVGWYRGNPGAIDALCLMYTTTKYTKEAIHPRTAGWTITEFITIGGQSTTNPPLISEIDYAFRAPTLKMQEKTQEFLRRNARLVAEACRCKVTENIVTKTRIALFNRTMAELLDRNFRLIGPQFMMRRLRNLGGRSNLTLVLSPWLTHSQTTARDF